jgi:hypothetical protein
MNSHTVFDHGIGIECPCQRCDLDGENNSGKPLILQDMDVKLNTIQGAAAPLFDRFGLTDAKRGWEGQVAV